MRPGGSARPTSLRAGRGRPAIRKAKTWEARDALQEAGLLAPGEREELRGSYDFLRRVQSRLRIVRNRAQDELPESMDDLEKLVGTGGVVRTINSAHAAVDAQPMKLGYLGSSQYLRAYPVLTGTQSTGTPMYLAFILGNAHLRPVA